MCDESHDYKQEDSDREVVPMEEWQLSAVVGKESSPRTCGEMRGLYPEKRWFGEVASFPNRDTV